MANNQTQVATLTSAQKAAATKAANKAAKEAAARAETAKQEEAKKQAEKASKEKAKQETKGKSLDLFLPSNPPTSGRYLFAFTAAIMAEVVKLPAKKQEAAARYMHGSTAMRHHGKDGTKKILCNEKGVAYDKGYFTCGASSQDEKRRAVPTSWVDAFTHFLHKGAFPAKALDGFEFKASGKRTLTIGL